MAISSTRPDRHGASAFATLRFAGDTLDPAIVEGLLGHAASRSYRRGEPFRSGPRSPEQVGKTGLWFLSTHKLIASNDLRVHTDYIVRLLAAVPERPLADPRFRAVQDFVESEEVGVRASCFWAGRPDEVAPAVPPVLTELISHLHGSVEIAFDHDRTEQVERAAVA